MVILVHTTSHQRSFFNATVKQWNKIPDTTRLLTHQAFKKQVTKQLGLPAPPAYYSVGSKEHNILHTRLRTQMSFLNSHRFQVQKTDTPSCSCGYHTEDNRHFVLHCSKYTRQRQTLFDNIAHKLRNFTQHSPSNQLDTLLHGTNLSDGDGREVARQFQNFIQTSGRFFEN